MSKTETKKKAYLHYEYNNLLNKFTVCNLLHLLTDFELKFSTTTKKNQINFTLLAWKFAAI